MVIFLLWLGLLSCCIANGVIYDSVQVPERFYYMSVVGIISLVLLTVHRIYTRRWVPVKEAMYHHSPVFMMSTVTSFVVCGTSLLAIHIGETSWGFFFASLTAFILYGIAALKEKAYIWELLAARIGSLIFLWWLILFLFISCFL